MNKPLVFLVNSPSPFGSLSEGARLKIGPDGIDLIISFHRPMSSEIAMIRKAPMIGGLALSGDIGTAMLIWRFEGPKPIWLDTPFNICIDPRPTMWRIPERHPMQNLLMNVFLQDRQGILSVIRVISIPPKLIERIEDTVANQAAKTRADHWNSGLYYSEIAALYRRWPTMRDAMHDAVVAKLGR